jgi:hypothetical protein
MRPPKKLLDPKDPEARRIADRIASLRGTLSRDSAESVVEIGAELEAAAARMHDRDYRAWLEDVVDMSREGAMNYRRLHQMSLESPAVFLRYKTLGPSKLYQIARLPRARRLPALRARLSGKSAHEMSDAEFQLAIAPFRPPSRRRVTPKMRAHGLRMRIRTMLLDLRTARRTLADLPADSRTALHHRPHHPRLRIHGPRLAPRTLTRVAHADAGDVRSLGCPRDRVRLQLRPGVDPPADSAVSPAHDRKSPCVRERFVAPRLPRRCAWTATPAASTSRADPSEASSIDW